MQIPDDLRYSKNHEWIRSENDGTITVGISDYAQDALGDVVYVELPEVGRVVAAGDVVAEVESTKSVNDVYSPVAGTITAVNTPLIDAPEVVNTDPFGDGWFVMIAPAEEAVLDGFMDAAAYLTYTEE